MDKAKRKSSKTKSYKEYLFKRLQNPEEAAAYLNTALEDEDSRIFFMALKPTLSSLGVLDSNFSVFRANMKN